MTKQGNLFPRGGGGSQPSLYPLLHPFASQISAFVCPKHEPRFRCPTFKIDFKYTNSSSPALLQLPHKSTRELHVWRLVPLRPPLGTALMRGNVGSWGRNRVFGLHTTSPQRRKAESAIINLCRLSV